MQTRTKWIGVSVVAAIVVAVALTAFPQLYQGWLPARPLSRAEAIKILISKADIPLLSHDDLTGIQTFTDVAPSTWFYQYIETAAHTGLVRGDDGGTFNPSDTLARAELAFLANAAFGTNVVTQLDDAVPSYPREGAPFFKDVQRLQWHHAAIANLYIFGGVPLAFKPADNASKTFLVGIAGNLKRNALPVTRARLAQMLALALDVDLPETCAGTPSDVGSFHAQCREIKHFIDSGLFTADAAGHLNPNQTVTRAELGALLVRAFGLTAGMGTIAAEDWFDDAARDSWFAPSLAILIDQNIISPNEYPFYRQFQPANIAELWLLRDWLIALRD